MGGSTGYYRPCYIRMAQHHAADRKPLFPIPLFFFLRSRGLAILCIVPDTYGPDCRTLSMLSKKNAVFGGGWLRSGTPVTDRNSCSAAIVRVVRFCGIPSGAGSLLAYVGIGRGSSMNLFDILAVLLVVALGIAGFREGLIRGGFKLAGFLVSLLVLSLFAGRITRFALGLDGVPDWLAAPGAFIVVLVALNVLFAVIAEALHRAVHLTPLGVVDSGLGTLFGVLKAVFVAGILALVLSFLPENGFLSRQYATSRLAPRLIILIERTIPIAATAGKKVLKHIVPPAAPEPPVAPERKELPEPDHEQKYYI